MQISYDVFKQICSVLLLFERTACTSEIDARVRQRDVNVFWHFVRREWNRKITRRVQGCLSGWYFFISRGPKKRPVGNCSTISVSPGFFPISFCSSQPRCICQPPFRHVLAQSPQSVSFSSPTFLHNALVLFTFIILSRNVTYPPRS